MKFLFKVHKVYEILKIAKGPFYKFKILLIYITLYFKRITGFRPRLKKDQYISIKTDGMVLPFFIKDSLDFDVLLDSMLKDQYFLIDLEKDEVRSSVKVIFDLGTNIGTAAIKFYQKFPKAIIYCFEPDPYNFERLQKNISLLAQPERIKIYNFAVSDSDNEKVSFYRGSSNHWSSSLIKRGSTGEEVIVETITLDTFCSKNNIEKIDILKMDIEGAESDALDGFKNNLTIVDYFIGEMHPVEMRDSVSSFVARFNSFAIKYLNTDTGVFKFKNLKINN